MSLSSDNIKCMASLAVFRELYNGDKYDIFSVIAAFASNIIITEKIHKFELQEFCLKLNNEYGFTLVSSVVKTSLNRIPFLSSASKKGCYTVDTTKILNNIEFEEEFKSCQEANEKIIDDFITFVSELLKQPLTEENIKSLQDDFCAYTIDCKVNNPENLGYISAFILKHKDNSAFEQQLTRIREGMIIYNGLSYTLSPNEIEKYDTELNIFLETEVLFNMAGYNGILCQHLFNEFYDQVNEINKIAIQRTGKKSIHLKYFEESFDEISKFFKQAEEIVCGSSRLSDPRDAMVSILNGCSQKYEIKEKQTAFEKLLADKDIALDSRKYTMDEDFIKSNLASIDNIDEVFVTREDKDYAIQMMLSKINYLRRIKSTNTKNFKQVGYILLSGNSRTLFLSRQSMRTNNEMVPLAEPMSFFTQRFWLSLNKGLLNGNLPITANIFTLSQITFSHAVNKALRNQFSSIIHDVQSGKLTMPEAESKIAGFRINFIKPEDINDEVIASNDYLDIFDIHSVDRIQAERALEVSELKDTLSQEVANHHITERRLQNILDKKNAELEEDYKVEMTKYNEKKQSWVEKEKRKKSWLSWGIMIVYLAVVFFLLYVIVKYNSIWAIVIEAIAVLAFVLDVTIDRLKIFLQSSIKYVLVEKERANYRNSLESKYLQNNPVPTQMILKAEDFD